MQVRFSVEPEGIAIAVLGRDWHELQPNQIVITQEANGKLLVSGVGDKRADPVPEGALARQVFSRDDFDPEFAMIAVKFWMFEALSKATRRPSLLTWLGHSEIDLTWADWDNLRPDQRDEFLELVAPFADVRVNGHLRVQWPLRRQLLGRKPLIRA
jgi:hypothetical protein